jgi:hypothetical protein
MKKYLLQAGGEKERRDDLLQASKERASERISLLLAPAALCAPSPKFMHNEETSARGFARLSAALAARSNLSSRVLNKLLAGLESGLRPRFVI